MLRMLQRPLALVLLPLTLLSATGCTSVRRVPAVEAQPPTEDTIVGITTLAGAGFEFDDPGTIRADTVFATVAKRPVAIPVDSVQRWWLRRTDAGKTVLGVLGITAGVILAIGIIAAATKESCPFIYSWDGNRYVFEAEPYGGAITPGLERDDYGVLPTLRSQGGTYRLLVTNEVNETQMTNLFSLWAVDHAPGVRVVPDEWGGLHTLSRPLPPTRAVSGDGRDLRSWLVADDRHIWEPLPLADSAGGLRDEIVLTFPRPAGATRAKLVTRAGTALWGSHMIRAMLELRGTAVNQWYAQVDRNPAVADSIRTWAVREELYGLLLQVEEPDGWSLRGILPGSGPFLAAERVVPLDLSKVEGDSLRIRIRPPRGFWALNSFAIDYSDDQPLAVDTIAPTSASDNGVLAAVTAADTLYHAMPNSGDRATLEFPAPPTRPGKARTVVLHSRGWYRLHLSPTGPPDTAMVRRILEEPGAAVEYSASQYRQWPMAVRRAP
ncbi:MAG TPA: hypothetical protein VH680_09495 [Gemmatimonadales bacterium]